MGLEKDIGRLEEQRRVIELQRAELESKWDLLDKEDSDLESKEVAITKEIRELRKTHFEEGFRQWKGEKLRQEESIQPYSFGLTEEETLKVKYIEEVYGGNSGAIGGGTEYKIIPTAIGEIITVKVKGKEFTIRGL